jgi:ATP-dependent Clp protease adaptor protein ClpS
MAVEPKVRKKKAAETETERALPWNVVVHNDPITLMSYVTMVFQRLFGYAYPKAHSLMMEVHTQGQRLHSHQLLASLEKAGS